MSALSDLRVIDFSTNIAGPFCAKLFADFGADVIKIEPPVEGDEARRLGPFPESPMRVATLATEHGNSVNEDEQPLFSEEDIRNPEASGLFLSVAIHERTVCQRCRRLGGGAVDACIADGSISRGLRHRRG